MSLTLKSNRVNHRHIGLLGIIVLLVGLLVSRVLISIGMIILLANAVINPKIATNARQFFRNPALLALTTIFLAVLLSGLYSENLDFFLDRIRIKLPFLVLPFAFAAIPKFNNALFHGILYFFFWLIVGTCLVSFLQYLQDFDQINAAYKAGKVLPTPIMHIRFSIMVVVAFMTGLYLYGIRYYWKSNLERSFLLAFSVFLFFYLHILAVRTGLIALYAVIAFSLFRFVFVQKKYLLGLALASMIGLGGYLAYQTIPTLQNKLGYMLYSLDAIRKGENLAQLSDSYRLANIEAGLQIGHRNPVIGVGIGDLLDETANYLSVHYPTLTSEVYLPQSQYVVVYAGLGLIGLVLFFWASNAPLWYREGYRSYFVGGLMAVMTVAFIVGHFVEVQRGTAFFLIMTLLAIRYLEDEIAIR